MGTALGIGGEFAKPHADMNTRVVALVAVLVSAVALPTRANAASFSFGGNGFSESLCPGLDAGNTLSAPCLVVGGPFGHIDGSLDPVNDIDFYAFHWSEAGNLGATYATGTAEIYLSLFPYPSTNATPPLVNWTADTIAYLDAPVGDYIIGVTMTPPGLITSEDEEIAATSYSIAIQNFTTGSTSDVMGLPTSAVPEPATLVLCSAGLLAVLRRRRT
jgi:hypothetical protein